MHAMIHTIRLTQKTSRHRDRGLYARESLIHIDVACSRYLALLGYGEKQEERSRTAATTTRTNKCLIQRQRFFSANNQQVKTKEDDAALRLPTLLLSNKKLDIQIQRNTETGTSSIQTYICFLRGFFSSSVGLFLLLPLLSLLRDSVKYTS